MRCQRQRWRRNANDPAASHCVVRFKLKGQRRGQEIIGESLPTRAQRSRSAISTGAIYDSEKNSITAVKYFRQATTLNAADARAWDYLGLNLEPLEQLDAAEQAYRKALAVNQPGRYYDAFVDYNYGRFLAKRNQLADAKRHLDHAVELVPQVRAAWYERAKLNLRIKNYQQARTDAREGGSHRRSRTRHSRSANLQLAGANILPPGRDRLGKEIR